MVISITTYYLAASLVDLGMSWWQGILTVFVGNVSQATRSCQSCLHG
jgi:NCS1 family nucleobase:cation symporter-1